MIVKLFFIINHYNWIISKNNETKIYGYMEIAFDKGSFINYEINATARLHSNKPSTLKTPRNRRMSPKR